MNLTPGISATDGITMNAAIVEDTQVSRELLSEILAKYAAIQGIKLDISAFASGEELLADYRPLQYTVIFFDIFLDGMNGVDAIAFTAGVGENDAGTRARIASYLGYLGAKIDEEKNKVRGQETVISTDDSKVKLLLVPTNEELAIARETVRLAK